MISYSCGSSKSQSISSSSGLSSFIKSASNFAQSVRSGVSSSNGYTGGSTSYVGGTSSSVGGYTGGVSYSCGSSINTGSVSSSTTRTITVRSTVSTTQQPTVMNGMANVGMSTIESGAGGRQPKVINGHEFTSDYLDGMHVKFGAIISDGVATLANLTPEEKQYIEDGTPYIAENYVPMGDPNQCVDIGKNKIERFIDVQKNHGYDPQEHYGFNPWDPSYQYAHNAQKNANGTNTAGSGQVVGGTNSSAQNPIQPSTTVQQTTVSYGASTYQPTGQMSFAERQARQALAPYEYQNQLRQQAQNSSAGYNSMISSSTGAINHTNNSVSTTTTNNSGRPANFVTLGSAGNYSSNNTGSLSSNINGLAMANLRNTGGVQSSSTSASYPSGR